MDDLRKRLTWLMLFRVGLVTLLLVATAAAELAGPAGEPTSPVLASLFTLIAATYGLSIAYALALRRTSRPERLAAAQVAADVMVTTALVHLTGGTESVFVFMYILVIIGASTVLPGRGALWTAAAAIPTFGGMIVVRRLGGLPMLGQLPAEMPVREVMRVVAINGVAMAATGALATRLSVELRSATERIASQWIRLRDLATLHQDVIRCLTSGLITVTEDGWVLTFNAAASEISGVEPARALGRQAGEVLPGLAALLARAKAGEVLRRVPITHTGPDGISRTLGVSVSALFDSDGRTLGRIVNFSDLTELRRLEEAVARSERLAAIGRLAAGIAHEIRNPLAAISGSVELLAQTNSDGQPENRELMTIVLREVERLNSLITGLLDFARPARPDSQPIDLATMVSDLVRVFENDKRLGTAHIEVVGSAAVQVEADPGQLRQVVWNLLRNAAEASPSGGTITVDVAAESDWARLTVRDRGAGVAPENLPRLFEPFFSTKDGGTGLGLATVHRIVEEHRGRIEVIAPTDGGAAFVVRLPIAR